MIRVTSNTREISVILLIAVFQLFYTSCSRKLYPEQSFLNIETSADRKKMKDFLDGGTGKRINSRSASADEIIKTAQKYLGVPHCMGGKSMKCTDCSGLLTAVFASHGIYLPHNSEEQARYGKIITCRDDMTKGDLVFFIRSYKTKSFITHSGIYTGGNKFIHTSSKKGVTITSLTDPWWNKRFVFGTRVLE